MTLLVSYDIESNKIRTKIAKFLEKKGIRIQKSVFAVEIERHGYERFLKTIEKISDGNGKIAVFELCKGCVKKAIKLNEKNISFKIF